MEIGKTLVIVDVDEVDHGFLCLLESRVLFRIVRECGRRINAEPVWRSIWFSILLFKRTLDGFLSKVEGALQMEQVLLADVLDLVCH